MQSRRDFLKNAALLSGAVGLWGGLEGSIRQALAIEPAPGSSFLDAQHVVILMQENRSFDHAYGTLRGVRGYNDPRALTLANGHPVWVQTDAAGKRYAPFRLDINGTKATWMGSLPHSWPSQVDARNHGKHDHWLLAKRSGHPDYAHMPLTLGHYTRQDIPFYYSLADAFTICDQHFCSSIAPTLPNRLYFWTGTVRERPSADSPAHVRNEQVEQNHWAGWTTFPERLEDHGVSWKVYQNELTERSGLAGEEDAWLGNFGDNILEYFPQFHVKAHKPHRDFVLELERTLPGKIADLRKRLADPSLPKADAERLQSQLKDLVHSQNYVQAERSRWDQNDLEKLSSRERSLHQKAFVTNAGDPAYRQLDEMTFQDGGGAERRVQVPKGDVFHQFREDVRNGTLPAVSWLVAPERLSDHPESAWYGAWYVSETLRILTENPEVWKKTIFILTYDENDGYFDHVPPFVAPHPRRPETGFTSKSVDATLDYIELTQDAKLKLYGPRESPVGLGYRVPLLIASPWSRGGCVCSQVFDSTSVLQFLEKFLTHKTGRPIKETNISSWRRTVCGDLTSAFQDAADAPPQGPDFLSRDPLVQQIFQARFKPPPSGFKALSEEEIERISRDPRSSPLMSHQEPGTRRSCPLPYELYVDGSLHADRNRFTIRFRAGNARFGPRSAGSPFTVYARTGTDLVVRNYAVAAGEQIEDAWALADFPNGLYHLQVYGPNGFFREFIGDRNDPALDVRATYDRAGDGNVEFHFANHDRQHDYHVEVADRSYDTGTTTRSIPAGQNITLPIDTRRSFRWYDLGLKLVGTPSWQRRLAGRVETGQWGSSDPAMGGTLA